MPTDSWAGRWIARDRKQRLSEGIHLPRNDSMRHARLGLGHDAEGAIPSLRLRESSGAGLTSATSVRDRVCKKRAQLGNGHAGQFDPDGVLPIVLDALVRT